MQGLRVCQSDGMPLCEWDAAGEGEQGNLRLLPWPCLAVKRWCTGQECSTAGAEDSDLLLLSCVKL